MLFAFVVQRMHGKKNNEANASSVANQSSDEAIK